MRETVDSPKEDARNGGLAEGLSGAHAQKARHVHAAGDDLGALLHMAGHALAGEGGGVELRDAFHHHAVDGHAFAGLDDDHVAHGDLVGVDLRELAVALDVGVVRRDVHHVGDGLAALAHGVALEELAHLVEEHDGAALRHLRVVVGEEDRGEGAYGGDRHEECLVEGVAAADVARGLDEHVVAGDEEGDEVEGEGHVDRRGAGCGGDEAELVGRQDGEEKRDGKDDAVAPLLLFLVHGMLLVLGCRGGGAYAIACSNSLLRKISHATV